jgi:hypothetical protein
MDSNLLHYTCLSEFRRTFYKDLLQLEHLKGGMISIEKFNYADGSEGDFTFWGWQLDKGNNRYLLPGRTDTGKYIKLNNTLPIMASETEKISYRGLVYNLILKPRSMRFRATPHTSFKQFVDELSSTPHSNPEHLKLLWFLGLASMMDRAYYRVCSPPSMGKSSVVDTLGHLIGSATKIVKPTLAKLEHRANYKWLVMDEANDIPTADWKLIDNFLLDVAAFSPTIEKHSMGAKQSYDVSEFSMSLFYNDVTDYPDKAEYFDQVTKKALRDRFPAFRVYGGFTADFNSIRSVNVQEYVEKHLTDYVKLIETFTYYKEKLHDSLHWYEVSGLQSMPERWKMNVDKLLKIIDLYCGSQEEFDHWVQVVSNSIQDYYEMSKFEALYERAKKKYSKGDLDSMLTEVRKKNTFKEKNELVENYDGMIFNKQVNAW